MRRHLAIATGAALAALVLGACSAPSPAKSAAAAPATAPKVGTPAVMNTGYLKVCTALSTGNPPTYYFESGQKPVGAEIDLAHAVGQHLGLSVDFADTAFASLIPSLQGGKCDVVMSSLYIKPEREKVVDFAPYMMSGTAIAVPKGNPKHVTGLDDSVCGLKLAATVGKTGALLASGQRDRCKSDGKPALQVQQLDSTTAGIQTVMTGQTNAYAGETPVILYYQDRQPGTFQMAGKSFGAIKVGAAVKKGNKPLQDALAKAFDEIRADGEYAKILKRWNISELALS
ncbi:ABC transporter substrate-binding protein [Streptomyces sp. NPDC057684]|uniref:ABC transporter substrate-binding protein n=1 Tax=unclassified Streptomyces TaxID=2593676 RepID=UPI00367CD1FE